jgi:hypothetical protein
MELLRGVSAANNFVLAIVPPSSSRPFFVDHGPRRGGVGVSNVCRDV